MNQKTPNHHIIVCFSEWWPPTKCKLIFNVNSSSVFNPVFMLFHTLPFFFLSMVAQKTSKLRYSDWLLRNFNQSESGYLSYHGEQNGGHHAKEHWKLSWKLVSKNSLHFVGSHHSEKQTVIQLSMHFSNNCMHAPYIVAMVTPHIMICHHIYTDIQIPGSW